MDVAVVGAGRAGTAIGVALARAGHRVVGATGRAPSRDRVARHLPGTPIVPIAQAAAQADLVVLGVPDDALAAITREVAASVRPGVWVVHLSGASGLDVLEPVRGAGARGLGIHPLQTFPDVAHAIDRLHGATMAVTADDEEGLAFGEQLARELGGVPFRLADELRPLYHAAAVFASNHVVVTSAVAEALFVAAGVPDPRAAMAPLQRATLENLTTLGAAAALTGPAVRGDAGTIDRNLTAVRDLGSVFDAGEVAVAYVAMARLALDLAVDAGRLRADERLAVEEVLARWR